MTTVTAMGHQDWKTTRRAVVPHPTHAEESITINQPLYKVAAVLRRHVDIVEAQHDTRFPPDSEDQVRFIAWYVAFGGRSAVEYRLYEIPGGTQVSARLNSEHARGPVRSIAAGLARRQMVTSLARLKGSLE